MLEPFAATSGAVERRDLLSVEEAGKTETSAPVSTRKEQPERRSHTERVLDEFSPTAAHSSGRPSRFPTSQEVMVEEGQRTDNLSDRFGL